MVLANREVSGLVDGLDGVLSGRLALPGEAACRRYARDHFDWPVIAARIRAVYEEALT
jgi:glycosyltransferase involved in cell wall biosynthesis